VGKNFVESVVIAAISGSADGSVPIGVMRRA
jgi:hypothetical protein